ncbi:MAG: CDP-2,3-bis-(O-geranylgeranyl)-sn-glycerol synthase [Desulfurococcales archaeon]|nr:CDP-2,3-bis-(O-geranylgeranyl)-sn-glycerol synthase [Desulfurococcales archaeon]
MDLNRPLDFFLAILPAMVANASPVASRRILKKRWHPVDFGKSFIDGRRLLGDGKTFEGLLIGVAAGVIVGLLESFILSDPGYLYVGFIGSLGALIGDMVGSFIKRRLGLKRGAPAPLLDQLDFYVGALIAIRLMGYDMSLRLALEFSLLVIALHIGTNYAAYKLGLKDVPW